MSNQRPDIWEQEAARVAALEASRPPAEPFLLPVPNGIPLAAAEAMRPSAARTEPARALPRERVPTPRNSHRANTPGPSRLRRTINSLGRISQTLRPFMPSMSWMARSRPDVARLLPDPGARPASPLAPLAPLNGMPNFSQEGFASAGLRRGSPRDGMHSPRDVLPHPGEAHGSLQFGRRPLIPKSANRRRRDPTMTDILNDDSLAQEIVGVLHHATMGTVVLPEGRANLMPAPVTFEPDRPLCQVLINLRKYSARERFNKVFSEIPFIEREAQLLLAITERKRACEARIHQVPPITEEYNILKAEYEYYISQETAAKLKLADLKAFQVSQTDPEYYELDSTFKIIATRLELCSVEYRQRGAFNRVDLNSIALLIDQVASLLGQGIVGREYAKLNKKVLKKMMDYLAHFKLLHLCYQYGDERGYDLLRRIELARSLEVVSCVRRNVDRAGLYEVELWSLSPLERVQLLCGRITRFIHRSSRTIILGGEKAAEIGTAVSTRVPVLLEGIRSISQWEGLKAGIRHTLVVARDALADLYQAARIDPNRETEPNVAEQFVELVEASQDPDMREAAIMLLQIGQAAEIEVNGRQLPGADAALERDASRVRLGNAGPTGIFEVLPQVEEGRESPRARYVPNSGLGGFDHSPIDRTTNNHGSRKRKSNQNRNNTAKNSRR